MFVKCSMSQSNTMCDKQLRAPKGQLPKAATRWGFHSLFVLLGKQKLVGFWKCPIPLSNLLSIQYQLFNQLLTFSRTKQHLGQSYKESKLPGEVIFIVNPLVLSLLIREQKQQNSCFTLIVFLLAYISKTQQQYC